MDSITQATLGAAVCVGAMGRRTPVWKAAVWGAVCGTLPDLDTLVDRGNALLNVTMHRAETHALFWLTLVAVPIAWPIARLSGEGRQLARWCLAIWLVLVTHALLDAMTVYGTRLALPFDDTPFGVGSVFIIDPMYTVPLVSGVVLALVLREGRGRRWNRIGIAVSSVYLLWSVLAQQHVRDVVHRTISAGAGAPVADSRILVTPTPFNTLLWRVVVMREDHYDEGYRSLLDVEPTMQLERFPSGHALYRVIADLPSAMRLQRFTRGFFRVDEHDGVLVMTDLRMGQHPYYAFAFALARRNSSEVRPITPRNVGGRDGMDLGESLRWLARRALARVRAPPPG